MGPIDSPGNPGNLAGDWLGKGLANRSQPRPVSQFKTSTRRNWKEDLRILKPPKQLELSFHIKSLV